MPLGIGATEIIIVLIIVLVIFGPKRLPDLGRSLGRGMREFKDSVTGNDKDELPETTEVTSTKVTSTTVADPADPAATTAEQKH
jgi:sec-independent protein translocase protein TatA